MQCIEGSDTDEEAGNPVLEETNAAPEKAPNQSWRGRCAKDEEGCRLARGSAGALGTRILWEDPGYFINT
jgi:hypothetical protein